MPYRLYLFELFITRIDNRTFSPYFVKSGPLKETGGAKCDYCWHPSNVRTSRSKKLL